MLTAVETVPTSEPATLKRLGPNLFELEYLRQLQEEIRIFLQSANCTTLTEIVIGVRGPGYQAVIPMTRGDIHATA